MICACLVLPAVTACASSRSLDESVTDLAANTQLKAVLLADRNYDYSDIDMTLYEGRLMLTGTMRTAEGRDKLIANAWKASGVDQVIDEVLVEDKTGFSQGVEDTRIDQVLRAKMIADDDIKSVRYKFSVSKGVIYVLGRARSEAEHAAVLETARKISNVKNVVSHVVIDG